MGIDTDRFVETVPQEALCPVCCLVLEEPVITSCGHYMCRKCWHDWTSTNKKDLCPYCCSTITEKGIRKAAVVKSLISNFNVFCKHVQYGCSVVHKLGLEDLHLQRCSFLPSKTSPTNRSDSIPRNSCGVCHLSLDDSTLESHECVEELLSTCNRLGHQVVNLEYENEKLSLRLTKRENDELDHVTELESLYQEDLLRYEKEVRRLQNQIAGLEGELNRIRSESEEVIHEVVINRQNGTLGFNIIGGFQQSQGAGSGIVVSRIEERSAADGPGRLRLHDKILKVNGVSLENASHDEAVKAFKCAKDPVNISVQRRIRRDPPETCDGETQTEPSVRKDSDSSSRRRAKSCELTDSPSLSCSEEDCGGTKVQFDGSIIFTQDELHKTAEFYDSAYDTLLTYKSSKSTKSSSFSSGITRDDGINLNENDDIAIDINGNESELLLSRRLGGEAYCDGVRSEDSSGSSILFPSRMMGHSTAGSADSRREDENTTSKLDIRRPIRKDLNRCACDSPQMSPRSSPRKFVKKNVFYFVPDVDSNPSSPMITRRDVSNSIGDRIDKNNCLQGHPLAVHDGYTDWEADGAGVAVGEGSDGYEYEYEEISLSKVDGRFGFELCYGGDEESLAVYVGEIEEDSIAEQDGRIMVGDQIIMINDAHVNVVEDAYRILQENSEVKLLVARPVYEVNSPEAEEETDLDILDCPLETVKEETSGTETTLLPAQPDAHGKTISSEELSAEVEDKGPALGQEPSPNDDNDNDDYNDENENENQTAIDKESIQASPFFLGVDNPVMKTKSAEISRDKKDVDRKEDLKSTLKKYVLAKLRGDNDSKTSQQKDNAQQDTNKKKESPMQKGQIYQNALAFDSDCGSSRIIDSTTKVVPPRTKSKSSLKKIGSEEKSLITNHVNTTSNSSLRSALKKSEGRNVAKKQVRVDNKPNWTSTEKRVWEEFKLIQHMEAQENKAMVWGQPDQELEWKVRRSKDGKHIYIRKQSKPAKAKLLKERAQRVAEERRGITTDEETQSVYLGKYWTREERRHQLNRQREKRRRLLQRINEKNSINGAEAAIAEIVQRNMTSPGKIFDDFFTVEEILMQRNRDGITDGPIQVTTV